MRYATVQVFNYNGRPMHTVKDCLFGLMEREHAEANEVFVPKTTSDRTTLANDGTSVVACVIDLERRDYVWADVEADRSMATLENAAGRTAEVLRALLAGTKLSFFELPGRASTPTAGRTTTPSAGSSSGVSPCSRGRRTTAFRA